MYVLIVPTTWFQIAKSIYPIANSFPIATSFFIHSFDTSLRLIIIWVLSPKPADYTVVEYKDEREVDLYM